MSHDLATWTSVLAGIVLTWSIQSSALLAVGLFAARLMKKTGPAVQAGVYRTTLVAVLVCPLASLALSAAGYDGLTLRLSGSQSSDLGMTLQVTRSVGRLTVGTPVRADRDGPKREPSKRPANELASRREAPGFPSASPSLHRVSAVFWTRESVTAIGFGIWVLGAAVFGARLLIGQRRMSQLRGMAVAAEPGAEELCRELADRIGVSAPAVLRSPFLFSPCLDGMWKPAILLPDDLGQNLRDTFVHELAHLVRRDGLWNFLVRFSVATFWVQPLLWILSRRLEIAAEEVCDDYVLQFGADRVEYAGHLLDLAGRTLPPLSPAAAGMVSLRSVLSRRIVRLLDTSRSFPTRAGARAVFAMLAIGLMGTLLTGLLAVRSGKAQTRAQAADEDTTPKRDLTRGQVVDVDPSNVAKSKSPRAPAANQPADVPIRGRIVDIEGRPVANVTVTTGSFLVPKSGNLSAWIEAVKQGQPPFIPREHFDWNAQAPATAQHEATTDADGRFRLERLGAERVVNLTLKGGQISATTIDVVTREMDPVPARGYRNQHGPGFQSIYGAEFTYLATFSRTIEGVVKDAKTAEPLVGADVRSYRFAGSDFGPMMTLRTKTDAKGRFRLTGMPKGKGNRIIIVPTDDQPYLVQEIEVPDPPGADAVSVEAAVPRGVWVEGRLTEKTTGKPVPGAWLHYIPFLSNKFVQAHPSFHADGDADSADIQDRYQTKTDGSFRLVGLPGRAVIGAIVHDNVYVEGVGSDLIAGMDKAGHFATYSCPVYAGKVWPTVMKEIDLPADATSIRVELEATNGFSARLRVIDAEGKPVTGASTRGLRGRSSYERGALSGADANVSNLRADEERIVIAVLSARKIGKAVAVRKGDDTSGPVLARLEPLAALTGRVVDASGNPVLGAIVRPIALPGGDFFLILTPVTTDANGRFMVSEVPTGCDYSIAVESLGGDRERRFASLNKATVKPGETTEVGDIRFGEN